MTEHNPFEVPQSCSGALPAATALPTSYRYHVDGDLLACDRRVTLPRICIYTGATEDLVAVTRKTEFPSMTLVLSEHSADVTFFVASSEHARRSRIRGQCVAAGVSGAVMIFLLLLGEVWSLTPQVRGMLSLVGIVVVFLSVLGFRQQNQTLKLKRYVAPGVYWVRGFPLPYLKRIAALSEEERRTLQGEAES